MDLGKDTVAPGDLDVGLPGRQAAHGNGDDDEVGAEQGCALLHAAADDEVGLLLLDEPARQGLHHLQAPGIDVHQGDRAALERG